MHKTKLYYLIPTRALDAEDLESIINITRKVKNGVTKIQNAYKNIKIIPVLNPTIGAQYVIYFRTTNKEYLGKAVSAYMKISGPPHFVSGSCDIIDKALLSYGKKLIRQSDGSFIGKHVVNI